MKNKYYNFYFKYKNIINFDESEYDEGYEPSSGNLYSEIGDLCNEFDMNKEDVKWILDNLDCSFDCDKLLQSTYNYWE